MTSSQDLAEQASAEPLGEFLARPLATASELLGALMALWPGVFSDSRLTALVMAQDDWHLTIDSRHVTPGSLFIAVPGIGSDGRDYIASALEKGAALVVAQQSSEGEAPPESHADERVVWLEGLGAQLGELGRQAFGVPESLTLVGVTGTNGKSSVTHYIAEFAEALGIPSGMIGTLGIGCPGALVAGERTTPDALAVQAALKGLSMAGAELVAMEVSSHALDQDRVNGCRFTVAGYTNLSRDHLDYHGSMAAYAAAKAKLFKRPELKLAVLNADDALARLMLAGMQRGVRVLAMGRDEVATLRVLDVFPEPLGQVAVIATPDGERELGLNLMGRFNLDNALLAMLILHGLGHSLADLFAAAPRLTPVPGRMQRLTREGAPVVVVDYAHTPEAVETALTALRAHLPARDDARLWCVLGCGGDRDTGKRPLMATAAEQGADRVVITDDNPRSEEAAVIRQQMMDGIQARERAREIAGRAEAIAQVIRDAGEHDVILIAGKGHEDYQEVAGERLPFSDVAHAVAALERRALSTQEGLESDA
ncbi:UDP-N-acetylmuramoyl-L-alanyl-D-glutamate--2,6-diaminopimelate ligase [Cobetia sp. 10Alg 146]|uniref:UDP-N-acetylmuramoyl-L-alanyl-D-glutamate--2, 6-diaminopimelate ligase n=1 Tax=Cobetia sp. 10Alg 146 TaxID=3040019 RepID=UPI002447A3A2|nr:UDP-N-acetylmuramoyl-L-alanyl-D-glutamate--2,6-diaminopimelate ligase [Cobetia sp. 10Alg 146]MDH2290672.1 UDP-N-acetylmuramoyl-L-alanyl-D-glutamate--2,6-diaminopimelate ligase [Cobetia sp. 10Alg 146]